MSLGFVSSHLDLNLGPIGLGQFWPNFVLTTYILTMDGHRIWPMSVISNNFGRGSLNYLFLQIETILSLDVLEK